MTVRELIAILKEHDPETLIRLDYGGSIEDIDEIYDAGDFIYVG